MCVSGRAEIKTKQRAVIKHFLNGEIMADFNDREDKPSWSEIDKRKDRSQHVSRDKSEFNRKPSVKQEWAKKQYLKDIEKLFSGKKEETEEQKNARKNLSYLYGSSKFNNIVVDYVKKYGLPNDWGILILMLDHKDKKIVMKTLTTLREMIDESSTAEREGFKSKVKILAMTAEDSALQELAEEIVEGLE